MSAIPEDPCAILVYRGFWREQSGGMVIDGLIGSYTFVKIDYCIKDVPLRGDRFVCELGPYAWETPQSQAIEDFKRIAVDLGLQARKIGVTSND